MSQLAAVESSIQSSRLLPEAPEEKKDSSLQDRVTILSEEERAKAEKYRKAAEEGIAEAQFDLGRCYRDGTGVEKDERKAAKWFRMAAEQGHAEAQCDLSVCYQDSIGVKKDEQEAVKWIRKAAEQGLIRAQCGLGMCYHDGIGVKKDIREAVKWIRKAAEQGAAEAQYSLGGCYEKGIGVEKDERKAMEWYQKAAEQGDTEAQDRIQQKKVEKCRKAAKEGNADAQYFLGQYYEKGTGVKKDEKEAAKWYQKAADQGLAVAQYSLGLCYWSGIGIEGNEWRAVTWYRKAAEQGHAEAQCNLAECYANGTGVIKDEQEVIKWYQKAADQGNIEARKALDKLQGVSVFEPQAQPSPKEADRSSQGISLESKKAAAVEEEKVLQLFAGLDEEDNRSVVTSTTYHAEAEIYLQEQREKVRQQENEKILVRLRRDYGNKVINGMFNALKSDITALLMKIQTSTLASKATKAAKVAKAIADMLPLGLSQGAKIIIGAAHYFGNREHVEQMVSITRQLGHHGDSDKFIEDFAVRALPHYFSKFSSFNEKAYANFACVVVKELLAQLMITTKQVASQLEGAELYAKAEAHIQFEVGNL